MKERPILFNGSMVRALLDGSKTQTRRIMKPQPSMDDRGFLWWHWSKHEGCAAADDDKGLPSRSWLEHCSYGRPGDRLWVRETFRIGEDLGAGWEPWMSTGDRFVAYDSPAADEYCVPADYVIPRNAKEVHNSESTAEHWRSFGPIPSIHMPRWASRILLEITAVRAERLHDISRGDAVAEGIDCVENNYGNGPAYCDYGMKNQDDTAEWFNSPIDSYRSLRESINGAGSWDANPWVWVVEFKRAAP
jgi:hypothetical protein